MDLALILKSWNAEVHQRNKISDIEGLNSFSISLMLLYFMQHNCCIVDLQELYQKKQTLLTADGE